jgi:hypothetical protein
MHAWANEGSTAPTDVVNSVSAFTERTQKDWAAPNNQGQYTPNIALQCTDVHDGGDGFTYATFKVATSMLQVGGVYQTNRENYQCSFATLRIRLSIIQSSIIQ